MTEERKDTSFRHCRASLISKWGATNQAERCKALAAKWSITWTKTQRKKRDTLKMRIDMLYTVKLIQNPSPWKGIAYLMIWKHLMNHRDKRRTFSEIILTLLNTYDFLMASELRMSGLFILTNPQYFLREASRID